LCHSDLTSAASLGASRTFNASAVSTDDIKTLIAQKERELHDINEFRQQSLESVLIDKVCGWIWLHAPVDLVKMLVGAGPREQ
jgi:hypothetical protein